MSPRRLAQVTAALAWGLAIVLGALHLAYPLGGDQALFLHYAAGLDGGARLYVDLWDNKQPGIFWFYGLAGRLGGFDDLGVHAVELAWMLAAAGLALLACRRALRTAWPVALVPLLTTGLYYWCASDWHMTQIEILVSLPLAGCLLAGVSLLREPRRAAQWQWLFGVCAGAVAVFKLVLVAVPAAMWLALFVWARRDPDLTARRVLTRWLLPAGAGGALVLLAVAAVFWAQGSLAEFAWTTFVYPTMAIREVAAKPLRDLVRHGAWLAWLCMPALPLAVWTLRDLRRESLRPIEGLALAWLIAGLGIILIQKFSWWPYHFLLLLFPVGVLLASGFDRLALAAPADKTGRALALAALTLGLMLVSGHRQAVVTAKATVAALRASPGQGERAFQAAIDPQHQSRIEGTAFLRDPAAGTAPVYVFGNPNWILRSVRRQALPIHGWAWEFMLTSQWTELPDRLAAARPAWLYVDAEYAPMIAQRSPRTQAFITANYRALARTDEGGTWYQASPDARGAGGASAARSER